MGRHAARIEDSLGQEIYDLWVTCASEPKKISETSPETFYVVPGPYAFWSSVLVGQGKLPMSKGTFDYWLLRLQIGARPLVWRDPITGAFCLRDIQVTPR